MKNHRLAAALSALIGSYSLLFGQQQPTLYQKPTLSKTHIVFVYAGDLWSVPRDGGDAVRLTAGVGIETDPKFSPDGTKVAFTGEYDGNIDVYVVPAAGGVPKRVTYHPSPDQVVAWTPDGAKILFRSQRESYSRLARLYTVAADGGFPELVQLPMAYAGAYSPDGSKLAYTPLQPAFERWKRYRGGQTNYIWIASLADAKIERIPRENSNDFNPLWAADGVYFLSDRKGPFTLYKYDSKSRQVTEAVPNTGLDLKSASLGPDAIVYEQFGSVWTYDLKSKKTKPVEIRIAADLPGVRRSIEKVADQIRWMNLSPSGARAVFEARGDIFTVPADKGDPRNLTGTPGVHERSPAWSPDGKWIAYLSDEQGEYELHIRQQNGSGDVQKIRLAEKPAFYYELDWSPDSKKILYRDSMLRLFYHDLDAKKSVEVDADRYDSPWRNLNPVWAPDSKWIAYTKQLKNHLRAVFLYSLTEAKAHQVSDGMSDAQYAAFDPGGKLLYFTASTNLGLSTAWLDMSSLDHTTTRSVYVTVLSKEDPSPLAPESDEEKDKAAEEKKAEDKKAEEKKTEGNKAEGDAAGAKKVKDLRVDIEGIDQRILGLPIVARNYVGTLSPKEGVLLLLEDGSNFESDGPPSFVLHKFEMKTRKTDKVTDNVQSLSVSANGEKMLLRMTGNKFVIAPAGAVPKAGEGVLKTELMEMRVDPAAEWKQIYNEIWRIQRDFFYDPGLHGLNLADYQKKYEKWLGVVAHRADLNYLFSEMLGELSVGHMNVGGGALPRAKAVGVGLLGADYKIENGRYRIARVYSGENWNPRTRAPLTQPGVNVKAGEYVLAVNGKEVRASDEIYSFFEGLVDRQVHLRVGPDPSGSFAREVTVVPVANEFGLRNLAWIEDNRRKVDQMTGGRVAYVYLPNTANAGFVNFNRYFFAQVDREAAVIDERFNGGGQVAEYIIDYLNRPLLSYWDTRAGEDFTTPQNSIYGPKVMLINEMAGSGGDALPWMFRQRKLGTLVGKRTWGGLVGIFGFPPLLDGGFVTAPNLAFWNPNGTWDVENAGVPPDIEVDLDPEAWRAGRDTQLEKAVELVMAEVKKNPRPSHKKPAYPRYH